MLNQIFSEIIFGPGNFGVSMEALAIFLDQEYPPALGRRGCPTERTCSQKTRTVWRHNLKEKQKRQKKKKKNQTTVNKQTKLSVTMPWLLKVKAVRDREDLNYVERVGETLSEA